MKPILKSLTLFFALSFSLNSFSQVDQQTGWFASFNTIKLNKAFSLHAEIQIRSTDDWEQIQTVLPRLGLNYHFKPNQTLTVGYAYIPNRSSIGSKSKLLSEHRIFQQYIITHKAWKASVAHRFRLEERWIPAAALENNEVVKAGDRYTTRIRYFIRGIIPLTHTMPFEKGMFTALQNELFLNASHKENVNGQVFDQNRAYVALGYRFSKKLDIEAGYLNQYVNRRPLVGGNANNDVRNHVFQIAIYTKL